MTGHLGDCTTFIAVIRHKGDRVERILDVGSQPFLSILSTDFVSTTKEIWLEDRKQNKKQAFKRTQPSVTFFDQNVDLQMSMCPD